MARSSRWSRYLQAESRLVGLGLIEKRKPKPRVRDASDAYKRSLMAIPSIDDIVLTTEDDEIIEENAARMLAREEYMLRKHQYYSRQMRFWLVNLTGHQHGSHHSHGLFHHGALRHPIACRICPQSGQVLVKYVFEMSKFFGDVCDSLQRHPDRSTEDAVRSVARNTQPLLRGNEFYIRRLAIDMDNSLRLLRSDRVELEFGELAFTVEFGFDLLADEELCRGLDVLCNSSGYLLRPKITNGISYSIPESFRTLLLANYVVPRCGEFGEVYYMHRRYQVTPFPPDPRATDKGGRIEAEEKRKRDLLKSLGF